MINDIDDESCNDNDTDYSRNGLKKLIKLNY